MSLMGKPNMVHSGHILIAKLLYCPTAETPNTQRHSELM